MRGKVKIAQFPVARNKKRGERTTSNKSWALAPLCKKSSYQKTWYYLPSLQDTEHDNEMSGKK